MADVVTGMERHAGEVPIGGLYRAWYKNCLDTVDDGMAEDIATKVNRILNAPALQRLKYGDYEAPYLTMATTGRVAAQSLASQEVPVTPEQQEWVNAKFYFTGSAIGKNAIAGAFNATTLFLDLYQQTRGLNPLQVTASEAHTILTSDWFPKITDEASAAQQAYWQIPDNKCWPDLLHKRARRIMQRDTPVLVLDDATPPEGGIPAARLSDEQIERIKFMRSENNKTMAFATADADLGWAQQSSSGCPVRHHRLSDKRGVLTPDQVRYIEDSGAYDPGWSPFTATCQVMDRVLKAALEDNN